MQVNLSAPTAEGITAIGIWMLWCLIMVFAALCEFGMILWMKQRGMSYKHIKQEKEGNHHSMKHSKKVSIGFNYTNPCYDGKVNQRLFEVQPKERKKERQLQGVNCAATDDMSTLYLKLQRIDSIALVIFPMVFFVFIIVYSVMFVM